MIEVDTTPCDRCESRTDFRAEPLLLTTSEDAQEFTEHERTLCISCQREILAFIDGDDAPDREGTVDPAVARRLADSMAETAASLKVGAREIKGEFDTEFDHIEE